MTFHIKKYKNYINYYKCNKYNNIINVLCISNDYCLNEINNKDNTIHIWALEDGEITFWKDYIIEVKKGDIIIFPNSWIFPFKMNLKFIS